MPRGRRRLPDEVKALKGNPGKRKLALEGASTGGVRLAKPDEVTMPDWLWDDREKALFTTIVEDYLQRRIARKADLIAYARWAYHVHEWVNCKETLRGKAKFYKVVSNHGERYAPHPVWVIQVQLVKILLAEEDRLGLNPSARQNIMRGLSAMPAALGELFGGEPQREDEQPANNESSMPSDDLSPLGFLETAGKPH